MQLDDEQFFDYWTKNSLKQKNSSRTFLIGLSSGFAIGVGVIVATFSGWFPRATMVANSKMSSIVLFVAILLISVFIAIMYRKFKWEMQEQRFLEIVAKKNKQQGSSLI